MMVSAASAPSARNSGSCLRWSVEAAQHPVHGVVVRVGSALGVADAHAHARVFRGAERTVDGFDAVVPACGAAGFDFDSAEVEVHVVVDNHDMVRFDLVVGADGGDRVAGFVHVGEWLGEEEFDVAAG